ncbi:MAG: glutamine-hydrolyzing carbamoyl-phosphate synthase small subunit [Candidatus Methylacidiphilales bacterium]
MKNISNQRRRAVLALEDGTVFEGLAFGASVTVSGEICFNTSMTGYQEILTDPSYRSQIVTLTYPQIGNYGIIPEDSESERPQALGLVVRELSPVTSNFRSRQTLDEFMREAGLPGIEHVDTRALTKRLRVAGAMKATLSTEDITHDEAIHRARGWCGMEGLDLVKDVSCALPYVWDEEGHMNPNWFDDHQTHQLNVDRSMAPLERRIVAYDYGIKKNILRRLREQGFHVTVVPARTAADEVLAMNPDGIFLSNGPGDPAAVTYAHDTVRELLGKKPIFGICLGHQILSHALGGTTYKLKFGHRGGNHPVKDLRSGEVKITSQNHGFAVDTESFDKGSVEVTHVNLNDQTCEGLRHMDFPAFSVQYHPEAAPGPNDATYFFRQFREAVDHHCK